MTAVDNTQRRALAESLETAFRFLRWAGLIVVVAIVCSGITFVRSDEVALVLRLGRLTGSTPVDQIHRPGMLLALPYLVDQVIRVPVKRVQEVPISLLSGRAIGELIKEESKKEAASGPLDPRTTGYCVTGDRNIVHAEAVVKYQIKDPVQYALHLQDPRKVIEDTVTAGLVQCIGGTKVDAVLTEGKSKLAAAIIQNAQERLDAIGAGVAVVAFEFREVKAPKDVAAAFEAVVSAYVERSTTIRNAETYQAEELPKARADRNRVISDAKAYQADRLARARGDVATFIHVFDEYKNNPGVVRERVYREAMERVLAKVGSRVLIPHGGAKLRTLLPAGAGQPASAAPPASTAPAAPTAPQPQSSGTTQPSQPTESN